MVNKTNIRGSISDMAVSDELSFTYDQAKPSYVRKTAYEVGVDTGRMYAVEAKRGSERIIVRRIQ